MTLFMHARRYVSAGIAASVSGLRILTFALLLGECFISVATAAIVNESMNGATAPGWVIGGSAYLSASTGVDPVGNGWLRLTEPLNDQAGFAFFDSPFDISQGVVISFDYATWGGNGADGYSVFLFDGSYDASTFGVGASGGSLGYDKKTVAPIHAGLTGGYIGIGIDEYGNYSNPTEGRIGGPGLQANEVGVRGPYNHPSGAYFWLGGSGILPTPAQQLAFNNQLYRPNQSNTQYRRVVINLTPVAAPNYLQIDVYVQFGFNQTLTAVRTGLFTGRPVPASVKIGYAASTGGQNNYHEIRNLLIDPLQTDIDLVMTKVASSPSVTQGGPITYTVTVRNNGPYTSGTATNTPIVDTLPALLTAATWTCTASGGAACGVATGSGSINTTATVPFNGAVTYAIRSTVVGTAPFGSVITNTAALTPPAGITDYNAGNNSATVNATVTGPTVTLSGTIYSDANHNGVRNGGEGSPGLATIYAKLFRTSDMTTALQAVLYTVGTGSFSFGSVPSYNTYTIILSTNNNLTDPTPIGPNANWVYTSPYNYTLTNIAVAAANVTGLDLGLFNGSRISGKVINDNGLNGAPSNANDGILNAAETGISGVTVRLANATGATTYDTTTTGAGGDFVLYTNTAGGVNLRIYETNLAGYLSVSYNAGTTGGTYTIGGEYIQFAYTLYTDYSGILFGDVPANTFLPTPLAQNALQGNTVYYGHTFTPGSGGTVSFSQASRTTTPAAPAWPAVVYYRDVNCNGTLDGADTALPATSTASAGSPICILVQDTVPGTATLGTTDAITTRATFTYTNSIGPLVSVVTVTDTTTVAAPSSVTVTGMVYNDANHNGIQEGGENSPNIAGIYAKLFKSSDLTTMLSVTSVVQSSGTYTFTFVPPNTAYTIILSSTSTATFDPSFPNPQWVATSPANYTLAGVAVGGANLTNQNFGIFNGTRIDGIVLKDDGAATGTNANNGVQNVGETGITGQTVSICDNAGCVAIDTEATDALGNFSLYVPWATNFATARITQTTMPAGYSMVNYNAGNSAGSGVNLGSRYITFTFTRGNDVTGLVFSDVPDNTFVPTPFAKTGGQLEQLYYAHTFTPGSGGIVSFSTPTHTQPTWPALVYYQDVNCNGVYDGGDVALPGSLNTTAGTPVCILVKDTILATAPTGTTDQIVTRATFTFTNSSGPVVRPYDVTDATTVQTPNLGTSTKTWTDLNGGTVNAGDILQYTITIINSTATATAKSVSVTDSIPANTNSFTVVSIPALATDTSTTTGGTNGTGYLNVTGITVPPSSSVTIVFNVSIDGSATSGTNINNTATITQPGGPGDSAVAAAATVVAVTGNKPLYLYSNPTYTLSRTAPTSGAEITINTTSSQIWSQLPAAAAAITIDPAVSATVPVYLYIRRGTTSANRSITVSLQCSSGGTTLTQTQTLALTGTITLYTFNLPLGAPMTCGAGNSWNLTITNNSGADSIRISTYTGGNISRVVLPATTVIGVNSVNSYIATYPSTTAPASGYFIGGQTVYVRAVVSDPFGSYDIVTAPTATVRDSSNNVMASGAMTAIVSAATASMKTFEYAYTVPATGPSGIWSAAVRAPEGTEGIVVDNGIGTFRVVLLPSILVVKSSVAISDPVNGTTSPKIIPGSVVEYTVTVTNSGPGPVDTGTMVVTDVTPANTTMYVDTGSGDPVTFSCSAVPPCGLTYNYATAVTYSSQAGGGPPYTYTPAGSFDTNVTGIRINPAAVLNGSAASPYPQFTIKYRLRIN